MSTFIGQGVFYYWYDRKSKEPTYTIANFKRYCKSWNMSVYGCESEEKGLLNLNLDTKYYDNLILTKRIFLGTLCACSFVGE